MKHHHTTRRLPRATFGVLAIAFLASLLLLQSCKRADGMTAWTPSSPTPVAYLEDSVLTSRVKAALLLSPVVRSINIGVESHQGVVLLSGMVADPTQLDLALFVAQNVPGVTKVDNFMFHAGTAPASGNQSVYSSAPQLLQRQRAFDRTPHLVANAAGETPAEDISMKEETDDTAKATEPLSALRRWVRGTYVVLGISSIHDELQIK